MACLQLRSILRAFLAAVLVSAVASPPAAAAPIVDLSWDSCSPIVTAKQPTPEQPISVLFGSVTGMTDPHIAYNGSVWFSGAMPCRSTTATPDAWRFDTGGCNWPNGRLSSFATKACPPLAAASFSTMVLSVISHPDDDGVTPPGAMRLNLAVAYPGEVQTPDPGKRYQLFRIEFDHTFSVAGPGTPGETCGGLEVPVCLALWNGYETSEGVCIFGGGTNFQFVGSDRMTLPMQSGQAFATFGLEPGSAMSCFERVPAQRRTWGEIKSQYRE